MHYAIVTETYPPEINGVALTVQSLERGLRSRGHQVTLVRPRQGHRDTAAPHEMLARGFPIPRYPGLRFGLPATGPLIERWRSHRPHAVYVATEGPLGWSALKAARKLRIPVATGFHTRFDQYMRDYGAGVLSPVALAWMRRFHNRADATLVPTMQLERMLGACGFNDVAWLPRAVDTVRFDPARRDHGLRMQWGMEPHGLAVIYVGRLAPEKNLDLAVRAFRQLQTRRADARFVLVGDGPSRAMLERENPDFVFCGTRLGESLAAHYASGDLFLFPSRTETFGNVTLEAMASGVATVAFDYGAAREHLRDGEHGVAVPDGDDRAFVAAAEWLAVDDPSRMRMGASAREAMRGLRPAKVASDLEAILQRLVYGRTPRAPAALEATAADDDREVA